MPESSLLTLSQVVSLVSNRTSVSKDATKPYVGLEHMPTGGSSLLGVGSAADSISTNGVFSSGDILFGKLRPQLHKCVRVETSGYCSMDILVLRPNAGVDPIYAGYVAQSEVVFGAAIRTEEGTKMPRCSWHDLKKVNVFLPKEGAVQKKIAAVLKSIDTAIEKTEALIAKHQQIKVGLMHDLFTRGVLPKGQLRPPRSEAPELYQETAMGWNPAEWRFTTCDAVCEKIIDCKNRTPPETPDGYPVIRTPNVRNGEFVDAELAFTDEKSYEVWTTRGKPLAGDIVITREAPVGEVCMIPERHPNACLGQRMMLYRPNPELIDAKYFLYALQSQQIKNRLELISGGSTVGHVRVGDVRTLWMFMPESDAEQRQIAEALGGATSRLKREAAQLKKLQNQKLGLMQDLLTGRVPVAIPPEVAESAA